MSLKQKMLTSLFTLLFIISPVFTMNACSDFIDKLELNKDTPNLQSSQEKDYFECSGMQGKNDLGDKRKCEQSSARKYYVIGEITPLTPGSDSKTYDEAETAICVPVFCNRESLDLQSTLLRFCKINNWNPTDGTLVLNDPNATPPRGAAFYVLVTIFYILLAICAFSTFWQNCAIIFKIFKKNAEFRPHWFFKAFDVIANAKSFYKTAQESGQSDQLAIFGFLRTWSMIWIAGYHLFEKYKGIFNGWPENAALVVKLTDAGNMGVGIFLWMTGFLGAYTLSGKASAGDGIKASQFLSDMLHRFYKVYPGYWMSLLLHWIVVPGMMRGTLTNQYRGMSAACEERWIRKLFMIDNWTYRTSLPCAVWTWYVNADFQLYPLLILLGYMFVAKKYSRKTTYLLTLALIGLSIGSGFWYIETINSMSWYASSLARAAHLLIGVLFGFQYYEYSKLKLSSNFCAWCEKYNWLRFSSIAIGLAVTIFSIFLYGGAHGEWGYMDGIVINLGIALFFVPLANNCSSVIKQFMNLRVFQILGKLGMGFYLLHFFFVYHEVFTREHFYPEYNLDQMIYGYIRVILYGLLAALLYYFILEKPLLNIEAHFSKRPKAIKPKVVHSDSITSPSIVPDAVGRFKYEIQVNQDK